ncbi:MAG: class I SAM-dependent methyltransferase [Anaerolineales bacterium]|nr:class I SAM-dependent methyltransferase [Anaerolineales bacterium]
MSPAPDQAAYTEYLAAKRFVDDRSLNQHVWRTLWSQIPAPPLRTVELGAGIGTMIERLMEADVLPGGEYVAVDRDPTLLSKAKRRLRTWAKRRGLEVQPRDEGLDIDHGSGLHVRWLQMDIMRTSMEDLGSGWDLLIAHALLDLVDLDLTLPKLMQLLPEDGWFWFTINFDGVTQFLPAFDPDLDRQIELLYHRSMDTRTTDDGRPAGDSQTGRKLLSKLVEQGSRVLAAGASDWLVHPVSGSYREGDAILLDFMLETVERELTDHPELNAAEFQAWLGTRRRQLEQAELGLLVHQIDICGQRGNAYSDSS